MYLPWLYIDILIVLSLVKPSVIIRTAAYIIKQVLVTKAKLKNHSNESTKVQTLGVFLGIDRTMSYKQRCYVSASDVHVSM